MVQGADLVIRQLNAGYGAGDAIQDVNLDLPAGSVTAVIGPNGSGKSTLLKAILGLTPVVRGQVTLGGRPLDEQRERVGYVPQRELVDWTFPVSAEQVVMMGRYRRIGWVRRASQADRLAVVDALRTVDMEAHRNRQIGALSGGQQQRVFLARALVQDAAVLLLDEPMTGVDLTTERLINELFDAFRASGGSVLYATHDLETAADTADYLCFLNRRVIRFGPPKETFTPHALHETFGGELLIVAEGGDHVHLGGHHGAGHDHEAER